jgi:hypothetical protein
MKAWPEVLNAAIAGKSDETLLQSAAYLAVRRLAGWQPPRFADVAVDVAAAEEQRPVSEAAAHRLAEMLAGTYQEFLPEWLGLAATSGRRVPAQVLPDLFDYAKSHAAVRDLVDAVAGARGRWLAAQNPEWAFGALENLEAAFATGARPARVTALASLRRDDPVRARALLEESWSKESGDDRAALLPALAEGLSPADEAFLETALKDRKRDVREAALDLLARLPESRLVGRMRERVIPLITTKKGLLGGKLNVMPPERCDDDMVRDGIEPKPPQGVGEKAWWLSQMVSLVPPSTWPVQIIGPAASSEWAPALFKGWYEGTWRFRDERWAEALLLNSIEDKPELRMVAVPAGSLLQCLTPERRDAIIAVAFKRSVEHGALMLRFSVNWSLEMSRIFVNNLERMSRDFAEAAWTAAERHCHPEVHEDLAAIAKGGPSPYVMSLLDRLIPRLQYRAAMRKELNE